MAAEIYLCLVKSREPERERKLRAGPGKSRALLQERER